MDKSHDIEHDKANSAYQHSFFKQIINSVKKDCELSVFNTYEDKIDSSQLDHYDAFLWTGGLGNIYENNQHNKNQIKICEKILLLDKPLWGSCWGLQVITSCYGETIQKCDNPEFGFSKNIEIINDHQVYKNKKNFFTSPGHHYDHINNLPSDFEIIAKNNISIQSIAHKSKNIFCTQYHPELPYSFIGNLMKYWKKNYISNENMSESNFNDLINHLEFLENSDDFNRKLELENWLKDLN